MCVMMSYKTYSKHKFLYFYALIFLISCCSDQFVAGVIYFSKWASYKTKFCLMGWLANLQKSCTETSQLVQFNLIIKTESLSSTGTTLFN